MSNLKRVSIYLIFLTIFYFKIDKVYGYSENDTPAMTVLKYLGKHSYLGFSSGVGYSSYNFNIKSEVLTVVIKDKKDLFLCQKLIDKPPRGVPQEYIVYRLLWPNEVNFKMDPSDSLKDELETKISEMDSNGTKKLNDVNISATTMDIPIRFSYLYEFEGRKFRFSIDPCLTFKKTSVFNVSTVAKSPGDKTKKMGSIPIQTKWSKNLSIPISFYYRMIHTKPLDIFLCASAGLLFASWKLGSEQDFYYRFWNVGLMFEYPDQINFNPFLKVYYQKAGFPDPRIKRKEMVGIILTTSSFCIEFGVRFKILPDKSRCNIPNCSIKYDHVHGHTNFRGRSYFNS
ncbi:MAG: hypothetical protein GY830_00230 [Bacteroidetes bacterium]|nr:hypothetical protein [Bacteroidota bacterium]